MDGFQIANLVIAGLSLLSYILFFTFCLKSVYSKKNNDPYKVLINLLLLMSCVLQSGYYILHLVLRTKEQNAFCTFLGSINVYADYSKMSISIIKILYIFFSESNIKNKSLKLFVINVFASFIFPMVMGVLTYFFGDVQKKSNNLCYHSDLTYRVIVYIGFLIYYLFFFGLAWKIALISRNKANSLNDNQIPQLLVNKTPNRLELLLSYTSMIVINCMVYLGFVFLFINTMYDKTKFNLMNMILGYLIEPISIPLFLIFFGIDEDNSLEDFLNIIFCKKEENESIVENDGPNN